MVLELILFLLKTGEDSDLIHMLFHPILLCTSSVTEKELCMELQSKILKEHHFRGEELEAQRR